MSRYISEADFLLSLAKKSRYSSKTIGEALDDAPSIDIVFCKECMWQDKDNQGGVYCTYVKGLADINEDSFCSYGERKESE